MHRAVVGVVAALLLVALGASLGLAKDDGEEKRKLITEVIVLSGQAQDGEAASASKLDFYRAIVSDPDAPQRLRDRSRNAVAQLESELTAEAYAAYLVPLYETHLTAEEAQQLTALLRKPILAKWVRLQKDV